MINPLIPFQGDSYWTEELHKKGDKLELKYYISWLWNIVELILPCLSVI